MNSLKITYTICTLVFELAMIALAVFAPVYVTPDYYWWTALGISFCLMQSMSFSKRMDFWVGPIE